MSNNNKVIIPAFIFTAIFISLLLPKADIFKYNNNVGQIWNKGDFYAPYDFPILKTDAEFESDVNKAASRFTPIYSFNNNIIYRINDELEGRLSAISSNSLKDSVKSKIRESINSIYKHGIISLDDPNNSVIRVSKNGTLTSVTPSKYYTADDALLIIKREFSSLDKLSGFRIEDFIVPNLTLDEKLNRAELEAAKAEISQAKGFVVEESLIIKNGDVITKDIDEKLKSLNGESKLRQENQNSITMIAGNFLYVIVLLSISYTFLFYFRQSFSKKTGNVLFILFIYIIMSLFSFGVSKFSGISMYLIPFAIVPFYIVTFYDIRMSIFEYTIILLLCAPFSEEPINFLFINLAAGLAGIFTMKNAYHRKRMLGAVGMILITYILSYIAVSLMENLDLYSIKWQEIIWFVVNILLFLGFYQLIYIFEKIFGFVTDITLFELCDTNHFILRELAENAPGTFQHSMQVANLAEAAAKSIGANPLYARTGALYHDIGKLDNPLYFIENNVSSVNPHDELSPLESTLIIKSHVEGGIKLARKYNLPTIIDDFITMHHGKSLIYYFYSKHKSNNPDEVIDEDMFRYDGENPVTKEVTICMIADSVEAASRSLRSYSNEEISKLVDGIVDNQMKEGNFVNSTLSFADITKIKEVFKSKIEGIYHKRIEYPKR
ncbi:MAG: HDIG domain-containing protein [Rikenellaceae bacterium]